MRGRGETCDVWMERACSRGGVGGGLVAVVVVSAEVAAVVGVIVRAKVVVTVAGRGGWWWGLGFNSEADDGIDGSYHAGHQPSPSTTHHQPLITDHRPLAANRRLPPLQDICE